MERKIKRVARLNLTRVFLHDENIRHPLDRRKRIDRWIAQYDGSGIEYRKAYLLPVGSFPPVPEKEIEYTEYEVQ
jgi:hypothetical protein